MSEPVPNQFRDEVKESELSADLLKLYHRAESAMELRNWGFAIALLQPVLSREPGFLHGRKMLRTAAIKENENKKGIKLGADSLKVLQMRGQVKKDPAAVIAALEKEILATDPYHPQANELLYEAAIAAGLPMTAGFALETVIEGHPDNTKFFHKLGDYYMEKNAFDKAAEIYNKIVQKDRTDLEATKKFKDATAKGSIVSQKWDKDGDWRDKLKDKSQASNLEKASRAAMTPEMLREKAAELVEKYSADPNNLPLVKELAKTYEELEDFPSALQFYEWAFHLTGSKDPSIERTVAVIKEKVGILHHRALEKFIEENPDHPDVERCKAELEELKKAQLATLISEAQDRVNRNPTDADLRFELGERLFRGDRYREAIQHLQVAKTNPSLRQKVMSMLGKCYDKMNMSDLAARQFEEAIAELTAMDEVKKDALYNLALLYERMGNKEKYLSCLKQIYEVDYNYRDVASRVEESYS